MSLAHTFPKSTYIKSYWLDKTVHGYSNSLNVSWEFGDLREGAGCSSQFDKLSLLFLDAAQFCIYIPPVKCLLLYIIISIMKVAISQSMNRFICQSFWIIDCIFRVSPGKLVFWTFQCQLLPWFNVTYVPPLQLKYLMFFSTISVSKRKLHAWRMSDTSWNVNEHPWSLNLHVFSSISKSSHPAINKVHVVSHPLCVTKP